MSIQAAEENGCKGTLSGGRPSRTGIRLTGACRFGYTRWCRNDAIAQEPTGRIRLIRRHIERRNRIRYGALTEAVKVAIGGRRKARHICEIALRNLYTDVIDPVTCAWIRNITYLRPERFNDI